MKLANHENEKEGILEDIIKSDDELLEKYKELELLPFSTEYWKTEYRECSENFRHAERLRTSIMLFWASFNGFLFVACGVALRILLDMPVLGISALTIIGVVGLFVSRKAMAMEKREMDYFREWARRCRVLEARANFYGQYWRTYWKLVKDPKKESRVKMMKNIYTSATYFWMTVSFVSIISLLILLHIIDLATLLSC